MSDPLREQILATLNEVAQQNGVTLPDLSDDCELLATGLDSLGFATMVTLLEMQLGYDPFLLMDEPVYPQTFGELLGIYRQFWDRRQEAA